jgi:hypothetical protein
LAETGQGLDIQELNVNSFVAHVILAIVLDQSVGDVDDVSTFGLSQSLFSKLSSLHVIEVIEDVLAIRVIDDEAIVFTLKEELYSSKVTFSALAS